MQTDRDVGRLQYHGRYMSSRQLSADSRLNLLDELRAELRAGCHLQEQHDPLVASVSALLSHAQAVLHLCETLHCNHIHVESHLYIPSCILYTVTNEAVCRLYLLNSIFCLSLSSSQQLIVTYLEQFCHKIIEGGKHRCYCVNVTVSRSQPAFACQLSVCC